MSKFLLRLSSLVCSIGALLGPAGAEGATFGGAASWLDKDSAPSEQAAQAFELASNGIVLANSLACEPSDLDGTLVDAGANELAFDVHVQTHFTRFWLRSRRFRGNGAPLLVIPTEEPSAAAVDEGTLPDDAGNDDAAADTGAAIDPESVANGLLSGVNPAMPLTGDSDGILHLPSGYGVFATNWAAQSTSGRPAVTSIGDGGFGGVGGGGGGGFGNFNSGSPGSPNPDGGGGNGGNGGGGDNGGGNQPPNTPTPEPASLALWCLIGVGGVAYSAAKRRLYSAAQPL